MLVLPGSAALSAFRLQRLLDTLRSHDSRVRAIDAGFVHFVQTERALSTKERSILDALLTYGPRGVVSSKAKDQLILVVPRPGTISSWSSKATDIAHVCGLDVLERVERGIAYAIRSDESLNKDDLRKLAPHLHDRMTEAPLYSYDDAGCLFAQSERRKLTSIDVLGGGRDA